MCTRSLAPADSTGAIFTYEEFQKYLLMQILCNRIGIDMINTKYLLNASDFFHLALAPAEPKHEPKTKSYPTKTLTRWKRVSIQQPRGSMFKSTFNPK